LFHKYIQVIFTVFCEIIFYPKKTVINLKKFNLLVRNSLVIFSLALSNKHPEIIRKQLVFDDFWEN